MKLTNQIILGFVRYLDYFVNIVWKKNEYDYENNL